MKVKGNSTTRVPPKNLRVGEELVDFRGPTIVGEKAQQLIDIDLQWRGADSVLRIEILGFGVNMQPGEKPSQDGPTFLISVF